MSGTRPIAPPRGAVHPALLFALVAILCGAAIIWLRSTREGDGEEAVDALRVACAAGVRTPVERAARDYEERYGVRVEFQFGGSGTLLAQLEVAPEALDLYLAGDDSFVAKARAKGLVAEQLDVARMRPVVGVARGNPRGIAVLSDLCREDLRLGLANAEAAAVGRITRAVLTEAGLVDRVAPALTEPTVTGLATALEVGALDAAVIWDATAAQFDAIEAVHLPEFDAAPRHVTLGVTSATAHPTAALRFARFLTARDTGLPHFAASGFEVIDGDEWAERPELLLMSGAMLNAAIDSTVTAFERREGCTITRVYNGCGILVAQMDAGTMPDAYFSCDESFMDAVADRFLEQTVVSQNDIVILVASGNPNGIAALGDLCRAGLRIGLGHPEESALGALTDRMLEAAGLRDSLRATGNVVVESATGDLLVNQIQTGALDAVVVYRSNAAQALDHLDIVSIDRPDAVAIQPYAVARNSGHRHLLNRLLATLERDGSRERFEALGFSWRSGSR